MRKMRALVISLTLCVSLSGCATLGSLDQAAEAATHNAIVQSEVLHTNNIINDAQFKAINVELNKIAVAGLAFTKMLEAGQATPVAARQFLDVIIQETKILESTYPKAYISEIFSYLTELRSKVEKIIGKL